MLQIIDLVVKVCIYRVFGRRSYLGDVPFYALHQYEICTDFLMPELSTRYFSGGSTFTLLQGG